MTTLTKFSRITLDLQPPVARIALDNPPVNVIDIAMMEELAAALTEIDSHPEIATLILSGSGKAFSVGVDVAAHTPDNWGFPEIKLGCYPPVAAVLLATIVGQKLASELILTGRSFSGREAAEMRLANQAVLAADLESVLRQLLDQLAKLSPAALGVTKKAIYVWDSIHFQKGLARAESIYLDELMKTQDAWEGINAFLEKRPPVWKGK